MSVENESYNSLKTIHVDVFCKSRRLLHHLTLEDRLGLFSLDVVLLIVFETSEFFEMSQSNIANV